MESTFVLPLHWKSTFWPPSLSQNAEQVKQGSKSHLNDGAHVLVRQSRFYLYGRCVKNINFTTWNNNYPPQWNLPTKQSPPIYDPTIYIALTSKPILKFCIILDWRCPQTGKILVNLWHLTSSMLHKKLRKTKTEGLSN